MFDPALAIDPVFDAFGVPVIVQETVPRAILAIRRAPDEEIQLRLSRDVVATSVILEIRRADMEGIVAGAEILVDGETRTVRGTPRYRDADRLIAIVNTVPA
ncbi:head-tail joining protein [Amaricoccus solimangrovi]|uniref:Uncharacterized protein n=1 Tax=Amaricoccus solimangrovi TaxID=2589815 RepID=A0A501WFU3_9RHOB|nr:hypothetical protein [Amaricoccus solimangrovi]TPE47230.1 hypothetical protein FJM51_20460 [Amaricoccus solimangrovi]